MILFFLGAALLDFLLGDPWGWPHPVCWMGEVISWYRDWVFRQLPGAKVQRWAGVGLGLGLILGSGLLGAGLVLAVNQLNAWLGIGVAMVLLASCWAGRSLRQAAVDVLQPLELGDMVQARDRLKRYVGRDTDQLSAEEIRRAVFETVTENAVDGVLGPLFYAGLGALCIQALGAGDVDPAVTNLRSVNPLVADHPLGWHGGMGAGAVALALAYKAASTLDSMVGYREFPYRDLGWFSAKLEDRLTWLPCRLTVLCIALLSGRPISVLRLCWRDARLDPSPNSGWSECVYAAALGVQVGGDNYYQGQLKSKPRLGEARQPLTAERIDRALGLTRVCFLLWLTLIMILLKR